MYIPCKRALAEAAGTIQFILLARITGNGSGRKRQCFRTSEPHKMLTRQIWPQELELGKGVRTKFGSTNLEVQIFYRNHGSFSMQDLNSDTTTNFCKWLCMSKTKPKSIHQ